MIITDDVNIAKQATHPTTTAKVPHPYEFVHDDIGYNYRMPNINAALGCAQMERLSEFLAIKTDLAAKWRSFFDGYNVSFCNAIKGTKANNWLNSIILDSRRDRDSFLAYTNENGVMTRPVWQLMSQLKMFQRYQTDELKNSLWLQDRVVNLPSSIPDGLLREKSAL